MELAIILSGLQATLQAITIVLQLGDRKRALEVIQNSKTQRPSVGFIEASSSILNLVPETTIEIFKKRVRACQDRYEEVLDDYSFLPSEIDTAGSAMKACVCRELGRLFEINGRIPHGEMERLWEGYKCAMK